MTNLKVEYKGETFSTDVVEGGTVMDLKKAIASASKWLSMKRGFL